MSQNKTPQHLIKQTCNKKSSGAFAGLILFPAILATSIFIVPSDASATDYSASISATNQDLNVSAFVNDGTTISADNINVTTTCRSGYNLTLGTSVNDNNLYLNGNSNAEGGHFAAIGSNTALSNSSNAWGYYYSSNSDTAVPSRDSQFNPVPALGSTPATVRTPLESPSSTDINDTFSVYYGVSVTDSMSTGTYKLIPDTNNSNNDGTIVYYLTIADACTSYTVQYNPTGADNNGVLRTGTGTVANQSIKEGIATNLTSSTFTGPRIDYVQYYFAGWNTAQDGSGTFYAKGQQVTDLAAVGETITLYAQWTNCPGNYVCYDSNATTGVDGTMGGSSATGTFTTLLASNFSRTGYGFAGWNTRVDGSGTSYGPNETLEYASDTYSSGGLRLYAMWVEPAKDVSDNELTFQTENLLTTTLSDGETLNDKENGYVTALKDTRDNQVYAVAKLADGNYWMIENLRLDDTPELTAANTNSPSLPLTNTWWRTPDNDSDTKPTSNSLSATNNNWCTVSTKANCVDQSMLRTDNTTNRSFNPTSAYTSTASLYSYGNYYNWYSATAGNGTYSKSSGSVEGDLCPAGWQLPIGSQSTADKSFGALSVALGGPANGAEANDSSTPTGTEMSKVFRSYPNNFLYSGLASGSLMNGRGSLGCYWSSTAGESYASYSLDLNSSRVSPATNSGFKHSGLAARCLIGS